MKEELRQSEEKYRTILEGIEDGYLELDIAGNVTYVNPSACSIIGYSAEELTGMSYRKLVDEEGAGRMLQVFGNIYQSGNAESLIEHEFIRKDGTKAFAEFSISLIKDANGNPLGFCGIGRDITARKRMEATLRESEEKYRSLASTADSMYLVDRDYKYLFMNAKHLSRFGQPLDGIIGRPYGEFHSTRSTREFIEKVDHVFETGISTQHEYRSERDGRYFLRTFSPVKDREGGETIAVTVASKDITDRKHAEEERERLICELREALSKIRTLSGLLPICSSCKKIRNDEGYWEQIEIYISDRSEADFSHGMCPDCAKKLYPFLNK
jgi:PAS domain S-box-containing protein